MRKNTTTIAVIFDFDDTIVPDSTTKLLQAYGINPETFWKRDVRNLIASGFDPAHASLTLLLNNIGRDRPLGLLTNRDLRKFGERLERHFYPGLPDLIQDLRRSVSRYAGITVEFFIITGGLQAICEGSTFIHKHFSGIYGSQLAGDGRNGVLRHIARCITFTEKTRYLFEINKGLSPQETQRNPFLVIKEVPRDMRPVPWKNMVYIGDGFTDIPCFSLVNEKGGVSFGVFNPRKPKSAKRALIEFLKPRRVISMHAPRYRKTDELGSMVRSAIAIRCSQIDLEKR